MLFIAGCVVDGNDQAAVEAVLIQRQQALCNKDLEAYLSILSRNYLDNNQNFADKRKELESNFALFDKLDYRSDGLEVRIMDRQATVSGHYGLKITIRGREMKLEGEEKLLLRKESGCWKIVAGL